MSLHILDRSIACLLAGAAGDALGAPVEFMSRGEIVRRFGPHGIRDYAPAYGGLGKITDDTQMTLFTAEGSLRALAASRDGAVADSAAIMRRAYLRWLLTQGEGSGNAIERSGWLVAQPELHSRRAPGNTCLSALRTVGGEHNDSKGCGGIMRVAPCGIVHAGAPSLAFAAGLAAARLTHGHPTGYLAAGVFAAIIAQLMVGDMLPEATNRARQILVEHADHAETLAALDHALRLVDSSAAPQDAIALLGEGWIAEEALAIALYCALTASSLEEGIVQAVNITGDSDSTGAMAGNLLGALHGTVAIPARWLATLELRAVIETVARDLVQIPLEPPLSDQDADGAEWASRYPPN
jgi:ADP-ribosyl-[dinitrogen reductase] hydrolase